MSDNYSDNYDDIIDLPHHVSMTHPRMSSDMRAAQFSPFAALTGYEECLEEAVRQTSRWIELDDSIKEIINRELNLTKERLSQKASGVSVKLTYFVPDSRKEGGEYRTVEGNVKKIDEYNGVIVLDDGKEIEIGRVRGYRLKGESIHE